MIGTEMQEVLTGDLDAWVQSLPRYQQQLLDRMLADRDPIEVALAWLTSAGPTDTAPFGGVRTGVNLFFEKLLEQIHLLMCERSPSYEQERGQLLASAKAGRATLITFVATAVAPHVGAAAALIAPAVAIVLAVVGRAGSEAWCETLSAMIAERRALTEAPVTSDGDDGPGSS